MASSDEYQQIQFWEKPVKPRTWIQQQEVEFLERSANEVKLLFCETHKKKVDDTRNI